MSNRRTEIELHSKDGGHIQATEHETDSPILPVGQLRQLQEFRPDLIDWVIKRTEEEATARRKQVKRRDIFIFIERIGGLVLASTIAILGLCLATYLALHGAQTPAMVIGGGTLVSIVGAIVSGKRSPKETAEPKPAPKSAAKPKRR
jgi:hypothetical protein